MFSPIKLKERRESQGLSQSQLASSLGISRASYFNWESGKTKPNQNNLSKLSQILTVDPCYFESEYEIVNKYLQLNEINQKKLLTIANELYISQLYKYQVHAKLSAGLGNFYYEDYEFDTVYFDKDISYDIASWIDGVFYGTKIPQRRCCLD